VSRGSVAVQKDLGERKTCEAGTSFRGALMGEKSRELEELVKPALQVFPSEGVLEELKRSSVGELKSHMEAEAVQTTLFMEGWRGIKVSTMGDGLVLLRSDIDGVVEKAMKEKRAWWKTMFKEIKPWSPHMVAKSRRV
jgi:hypothetical protein